MPLENAQVLIVDDNAQVRTLLARIVGEFAAGVRVCGDAIGGLGLWLAQRPHLVLVDYDMPQLDGATFIRILRCQETVLQTRTAILMVTGHSDRDHVMAARDAGADGFIKKPLEPAAILQRAAEALALQAGSPPGPVAYV